MTTYAFSPLLLIGHPRRIIFVFFLVVCSPGLFAQSDNSFQIEVGVEHYIGPDGIQGSPPSAAAGGFFVEGKYQKGQFETGIKAGTALWQYGSDHHGVGSGFCECHARASTGDVWNSGGVGVEYLWEETNESRVSEAR